MGSSSYCDGFKRSLTKLRIYLSKLPYSLSQNMAFIGLFTHNPLRRIALLSNFLCLGIFSIASVVPVHRPRYPAILSLCFTTLCAVKTGYRLDAVRLSACAVRYDGVGNFEHYKKVES
jgi:hypothetical protein